MKIDTSSPGYVIVFTALISAAFTAAIMVLNVVARPVVERNERLFRELALLQILFNDPKTENLPKPIDELTQNEATELFRKRVYETELVGADGQVVPIIVGYSQDIERGEDGRVTKLPPKEAVVGYATPVGGVGFWEPILGYVALDARLQYSRGLAIVRQGETPGLGAKITEEEFRRQWRPEAKLLLAPPQQEGARFVYIDKDAPTGPQDPEYNRHVDAITGATQTSLAAQRFINGDLAEFFALAGKAQLAEKGPPAPEPGSTKLPDPEQE